jgi:hypothetical protein
MQTLATQDYTLCVISSWLVYGIDLQKEKKKEETSSKDLAEGSSSLDGLLYH